MDHATIFVIGISHKFAPISIRETVSLNYKKLVSPYLTEKIILSTCNRMEIYGVTSDFEKTRQILQAILPVHTCYIYHNQEAVKHLFRVACGIDSRVIGEFEILGQIRDTYQTAIHEKVTGPILHQVCKDAISIGKEARTNTHIATGSPSITNAVEKLIKKHTESTDKRKILIVGAGKIAEQMVKALSIHAEVTITNRTSDHSISLAKRFHAKVLPYATFRKNLKNFDAIICATSSQKLLITASAVKRAISGKTKNLCFIDLSVPRNVDSKAVATQNVYLYNLDDVQALVYENHHIRKESVSDVNMLIHKKVQKFWQWYLVRKTAPILYALSKHAEKIQNYELKRTFHKLHHLSLTQKDKEIISALSIRITNKLLAIPIKNLKQLAYEEKEQV